MKKLAFLSFVLLFGCVPTPGLRTTLLMAIDGSVFYSDGITLVPNGWNVDVTNKTQSLSQSSKTGDAGKGRYSVIFMDISGGLVAATSDKIEIVVTDAEGNVVQAINTDGKKQNSITYILTNKDIDASNVSIDIRSSKIQGF